MTNHEKAPLPMPTLVCRRSLSVPYGPYCTVHRSFVHSNVITLCLMIQCLIILSKKNTKDQSYECRVHKKKSRRLSDEYFRTHKRNPHFNVKVCCESRYLTRTTTVLGEQSTQGSFLPPSLSQPPADVLAARAASVNSSS